MGILTNLLQLSWQEEDRRRNQEIQKWQGLASLPNVRPELQDLAIDQLVNLAPKGVGGLKDIGGLFKGLIGRQRQSEGDLRLKQLLAATGRPETTLNIPGGSQVPPQTTTMGGGPGGPTIGGQQVPAPPEVSSTRPGVDMSQILPPGQQQIGPVRPSYLLSQQEQLNMKFDEMRQTANLQNDLQDIATERSNQLALEQQKRSGQQAFDQKLKFVDAMVAGGYPRDVAIRTQFGAGAEPVEKISKIGRPVPGNDPQMQAFLKAKGLYQEGITDKQYFQGAFNESGQIVQAIGAAPPTSAAENYAGPVKAAIQSLQLAHPDWPIERIKQAAGRAVYNNLQARTSAADLGNLKKEIDIAVERAQAEEYGVALPGARGGGAVDVPSPTGKPSAGPAVSQKIGGVETAAIKPGSNEDLINNYVSQLLTPTPGLRSDPKGFRALALKKGQRLLMEKTGLTPTGLDAALTTKRGTAKALQQSIQMSGAFDRLQNTLTSFGDILNNSRSKVNDAGVSTFNRWMQAGMREVPGDPDVTQLDIAVNAVARTYAQVLAGGYQSKAMPPVSSSEEARQVIASEMQKGRISAAIAQMKIEASAEKRAMITQQQGLYDQLKTALTEARPGEVEGTPAPSPGGPPPPPPPGGTAGGTPLVKPPRPGAAISAADAQKYMDAMFGKHQGLSDEQLQKVRERILSDQWKLAK